MINYYFLENDAVGLRPFEAADAEFFLRWMNDPEVRGLIGETRPTSRSEAEQYVEKLGSSTDRIWLAVVRKADGVIVGETGLLRMFPDWRTTDITIIIPDPAHRSQGYGRQAMNLMLDYAFGHLGFNRVAIGVVDFNQQALGFYEKLGFKREGLQEEGYFYGHQFHDFVMMRMLAREFDANPKS